MCRYRYCTRCVSVNTLLSDCTLAQTEQLEVEKARLAKEKIDLEATLDSESEYIVNKLQVQVCACAMRCDVQQTNW